MKENQRDSTESPCCATRIMSLTSELKNPNSPLSRWFAQRDNPIVQAIIKNHNDLMRRQSRLMPPEGTDFAIVGSAVCQYLRKYLAGWVNNPRWAAETMGGRGAIALGIGDLIEYVSSPVTTVEEEAIKALLLAAAEQYTRVGKSHEILQPFLKGGKAFNPSKQWLNKWQPTIADAAQIIQQVPAAWQTVGFKPCGTLISNATFPHSTKIGGADCQIIIGGGDENPCPVDGTSLGTSNLANKQQPQVTTLVDVRTSAKRKPFSLENFYQQISYVLLDTHDQYNIRYVAWFYSRQQSVFVYPISSLFRDIHALRQEFAQMIEDNYSADEFCDDGVDIYGYSDGYYLDEDDFGLFD